MNKSPRRTALGILKEKFDVNVYEYRGKFIVSIFPKPNFLANCNGNTLSKEDYKKLKKVFPDE